MKLCIPEAICTQCLTTKGNCHALAIKFFMTAIDFYLSVVGNCFVALGYVCGKVYSQEYSPCLTASFLILLGHFLAMISDAFTVFEDVFYIKQYRREFNVNRFFVIANILSIIGEYQELKTTINNTRIMACR